MGAEVNGGDVAASWGGVSIARHTVYATVGMTGLPNGYVIGYRAGLPFGGTSGQRAAPAPSGPAVVSVPQAQSYGYATPAMVVQRGGTLTYANFDLVKHNVVQDVSADHKAGRSTARWCSQFPRR